MGKVCDTKAGKKIIAAAVVKDGKQVGRILAHITATQITVNVWNWESEEPQYREATVRGQQFSIAEAINATGLTFGGATANNSSPSTWQDWEKDYVRAGLEVWRLI